MSDISAPALWSCLDYHINYYVQILHFISLYSCPFHPLLCCVDAFVLWVMIIVYIANHIYLQSVPKNAYSSTTSWAANWHWKAMYPQTLFRKTAIQKVRFFGTPCVHITSWSPLLGSWCCSPCWQPRQRSRGWRRSRSLPSVVVRYPGQLRLSIWVILLIIFIFLVNCLQTNLDHPDNFDRPENFE